MDIQHLRGTTGGLDTHTCCEMIITVRLINTSITSHRCVCVQRENSLSHFQACNMISLVKITMLCIRSLKCFHLTTRSLYPLINISPFPRGSSHPWRTPLHSLFLWPQLFNFYFITTFPGSSGSKESTCNAGDLGLSPRWGKIPLEKEIATHSSILAWRIS